MAGEEEAKVFKDCPDRSGCCQADLEAITNQNDPVWQFEQTLRANDSRSRFAFLREQASPLCLDEERVTVEGATADAWIDDRCQHSSLRELCRKRVVAVVSACDRDAKDARAMLRDATASPFEEGDADGWQSTVSVSERLHLRLYKDCLISAEIAEGEMSTAGWMSQGALGAIAPCLAEEDATLLLSDTGLGIDGRKRAPTHVNRACLEDIESDQAGTELCWKPVKSSRNDEGAAVPHQSALTHGQHFFRASSAHGGLPFHSLSGSAFAKVQPRSQSSEALSLAAMNGGPAKAMEVETSESAPPLAPSQRVSQVSSIAGGDGFLGTEDTSVKRKATRAAVCKHRQQEHLCRECAGANFGEYGHLRSQYKKGSQIREHDRQRSKCNESKAAGTGGQGVCEHGTRRYSCNECRGSALCKHKRRRVFCTECGGSEICEHHRQRSRCKECKAAGTGGKSLCVHGKIQKLCQQCGGAALCEHNRRRRNCKACGGSQICKHQNYKFRCKECKAAATVGHSG